MNVHRFVRRSLRVGTLVVPFGIVFAAGTARADGGNSQGNVIDVSGALASTQVVGAACPSPIGLCTAGTLSGDLAGPFFYTAISLIVLSDGVTGIFEGTITLQTSRGTIVEHDHTTANLQTGQLVDVITILAGTEKWSGATGTLNLTGSFNFATGVGASTYTGEVTLPQNPQ
jgi:hypothetical protein